MRDREIVVIMALGLKFLLLLRRLPSFSAIYTLGGTRERAENPCSERLPKNAKYVLFRFPL